MCDVMEDGPNTRVFDPVRRHLYDLIERTTNLDWLLLTKRPQNYRRFLPGAWIENPRPNVWLMTTVENEDTTWRLSYLLEIPAVVHGVSYEPALGPVDFTPWLHPSQHRRAALSGSSRAARSGPHARPSHPDWFRSVRDACALAGVPFLFKQWGEYYPLTRTDGIHEMPFGDYVPETRFGFIKKGKKESGRLLDGREHLEYPEVPVA
jgi:protein gp37